MDINHKNIATIKISVGPYGWCGNNYDGEHSGYYLTKNVGDYRKLSSYPEKEVKVMLSFDIPDDLIDKIQFIQIYDSTGFLVNYNTTKITKDYKSRFKVAKSMCGTKLKVCYDIPIPHVQTSILQRIKTKSVHEEYITIPDVCIKGDTECAICMGDVSDDKIYISQCQHIFHIDCLWKYLEHNQYLKPIAEHCKLFKCDHIEKPKPFPCPICREICESPFKD